MINTSLLLVQHALAINANSLDEIGVFQSHGSQGGAREARLVLEHLLRYHAAEQLATEQRRTTRTPFLTHRALASDTTPASGRQGAMGVGQYEEGGST